MTTRTFLSKKSLLKQRKLHAKRKKRLVKTRGEKGYCTSRQKIVRMIKGQVISTCHAHPEYFVVKRRGDLAGSLEKRISSIIMTERFLELLTEAVKSKT